MILDCTLRDGGYYNQWDFDAEFVSRYLKQIQKSNIDVVEIGYRSLVHDKYYGPYKYCTEDFLRRVNIPSGIMLSVMVNANEMLNYDGNGGGGFVDDVFLKSSKSPVSIVRVAVNIDDALRIIPDLTRLKNKGYIVTLNIMQISDIDPDVMMSLIHQIRKSGDVDVLYFADSFGAMDVDAVGSLIDCIRSVWDRDIGVHFHDNQGMASINTIRAYVAGAQWIDGTIMGMGRGAGNARTESLMLDVRGLNGNDSQYRPEELYELILDDFSVLHGKYKWGRNLLYELSSRYSIHPSYVQEMINDRARLSAQQLISKLYQLADIERSNDEEGLVDGAGKRQFPTKLCRENISNWLTGKDLLLLGGGVNGNAHKQQLVRFIDEKDPVVISLNVVNYLPVDMIDMFVVYNKYRIISELDKVRRARGKILAPLGIVPDEVLDDFDVERFYSFQATVADGHFVLDSDIAAIPNETALSYLLALIALGYPETVFLYGFDGYGNSSFKQHEMLDTFQKFYDVTDRKIDLVSITETNYPVIKRSIYDPEI